MRMEAKRCSLARIRRQRFSSVVWKIEAMWACVSQSVFSSTRTCSRIDPSAVSEEPLPWMGRKLPSLSVHSDEPQQL